MKSLFPYVAKTGGITVRVAPRYLPEQSDVQHRRFTWSYHVRIENSGIATVQLLSRHWLITNGDGVVEDVAGPGVVGQTPVIEPGQAFDYVSGCPLSTPRGSMRGSFTLREGARTFDVMVPEFILDSPHAARKQ
jgi:ApaG protein